MSILSFQDAICTVEQILSLSLGGEVKVTHHTEVDEFVIDAIHRIDNLLFREELRYGRDEVSDMCNKAGFFCLLVYLDNDVIAYDFGFDTSTGVFFSDSTATLIERKGIGTFLAVLELVFLYERGYQKISFKTEELDQAGRPLREIWEKRGYKPVSSDEQGITMELEITKLVVKDRINRYILDNH